mmetsp:Transcript_68180/g.145944  ORF Transcript_68180/g.145944 Transcript_68180/m.145944 type:complete len:311 (+) Transcript_68180:63-995(+)
MQKEVENEDVLNAPREGSDALAKDIAGSVNFLAGGIVSAVSKIVVYPMETKVFFIAIGDSGSGDSSRLWHGVVVKGLENFLYNGLLWYLKELVRPPPPDPALPEKRPPVTFIRAFGISSAAVLLIHPLANIVVGMQASLRNVDRRPLSALQTVKAIMKSDGPGGFFRGWQLSILLRLGSAMTLVVYDFVRAHIAGVVGDDISNFVAGLLGRLSEVYSVQPLKTLRARQQLGQAMLPSWSPADVIGLWDGVGIMAIADAVKIGIRFLLIERLRTLLQWVLIKMQKQPPPPLKTAGATSAEVEVCQEKLMGG